MKKSSKYLLEYLNLSEESKDTWKATIFMKDSEGNVHEIPVESSFNIRTEVRQTVDALKKKGMKFEKVNYTE